MQGIWGCDLVDPHKRKGSFPCRARQCLLTTAAPEISKTATMTYVRKIQFRFSDHVGHWLTLDVSLSFIALYQQCHAALSKVHTSPSVGLTAANNWSVYVCVCV